jgi:hypothetical protein
VAVPNDFAFIQAVHASGHYDQTTKIGAGRETNDLVWALHTHNARYGHLKKRPGQHQWEGHAVDNVLWLDPTPGQSQAVDMIAGAESTAARLQWAPDLPRYSASDWYAPTGPDNFQMTPHGCRLGASLFYLMAAARGHDTLLTERAEANLRWIAETLHGDYVRAFVTVGGRLYATPSGTADPWQFAGSFVAWPDLRQTLARATDWAFDHGLRVAWTLVGEGAQFGTEGELLALADLVADVVQSRPEKIELLEAWNEYSLTGGTATLCRLIAQRLRMRLGSEFPIALDTPQTAMTAPIGEHDDPLPAEVSTFYGGSAANVITPQWDRGQPNPRFMGSAAPRVVYSHEPRGPGASAGGDVSDWLPLAHDYIQAALAGYRGYLLHTAAGVWGGRCHPYWPAQNTYPNLFDHPNMRDIADALVDVKAGRTPNPTDAEPPMHQTPPYEEDWIASVVNPAIAKTYQTHQEPLNAGMGVWVARVQYRVATGHPKDESLAIVLAELNAALPPIPPA